MEQSASDEETREVQVNYFEAGLLYNKIWFAEDASQGGFSQGWRGALPA